MKRKILLLAVILIAALAADDALAQNAPSRNDSIAKALKLKGLYAKRDKLQNEIKAQDAKRNRQIAGVAPATLEEMNDRQDSICLALRSELVDVILEIKENTPDVSSPILLQQYNNILNRKEKPQEQTATRAGNLSPEKPVKRSKK